MKIALDMDDVLADFNGPLQDWHNEVYGTDFRREEVKDYHLSHWGNTKQEVTDKIQSFYESEIFRNVSPVAGAVEAVKRLSREHELYIITSRPNKTRAATVDWLDRNMPGIFPNGNITYVGTFTDKNPKKKSQICLEYGAEIIVEDSLKHAIDCLEGGIRPILLTTTWNAELEIPDGVTRVYSWREAEREIN